jgi:hypothetical protein
MNRGDRIMPNANQHRWCVARVVLGAALLLGFATSAARAESNLRKVCKIGMTVNALEPDGNAMNCRALGLQANAQNYQIGCRSADVQDAIVLTSPIHINDKSARLTTSTLVANTENAKHPPEILAACAKVWVVQ